MDKKKNSQSLNSFISDIVASNEDYGKKICDHKNIPFLLELYKSMNAYRIITNESVIPAIINATGSKIQFSFNAAQISSIDDFVSCVKKHSPKGVITSENKKILVKIPLNDSRRENRGK